MIKNIENTMQSIATEAYKKTARREVSVLEQGDFGQFQKEYAKILAQDYFYSGHATKEPKEKQIHLQKLKASIESLDLPEDFSLGKAREEMSLGNFMKLLEDEMTRFHETKEEKMAEEKEKLHRLTTEEIENIVAHTKEEVTLADVERLKNTNFGHFEKKELPVEVKAQIKKHFQNQGIEPTQEHEEIAQHLLEKGIELSKTVCCNIDALLTAKNKEISQERVEELSRQYADVLNISLQEWNRELPLSQKEIKAIVEEIAGLDENYEQKIGTSFQTIEQALENYHNFKGELKVSKDEKSRSQISFQYVRYKMTLEKALTLNSRGISIDKTELLTIEKELLRLELTEEQLSKVAGDRGISPDAMLDEMLEIEHGLIGIMATDYASVGQMATSFSLQQTSGVALANPASTAVERYDALGTQVRSDLGDSLNKAIYRLNSLLSANGIEITEDNLRAAAILGRGQTAITENNIEAIKEIDQKLQLVLQGLKPEAVLDLFMQGRDVLQMSVDELADFCEEKQVKDFRKVSDRIAGKLNRLEKQNRITGEQKEQLILFYRLLHTVEKSEGGAAATLMKDNRPITLENLYDVAKYLQNRNSFEETVDQTTGFAENNEFISLKEQIRMGILSKKKEMRQFLQMAEQELQEQLAGEENTYLDTLKSYSLKDLESLFLAWKNPSLGDVQMYKQFQKIPFLWSDTLRKLEKSVEKSEKSKAKVEKLKGILAQSNITPALATQVSELFKGIEADVIESRNAEEEAILTTVLEAKKQWDYREHLQKNHDFMQIPIWTGNQLHQINVYYPKYKQQEVKANGEIHVLLSFETTTGGKTTGLLHAGEDKGELLLNIENQKNRNHFIENISRIADIFRENAFPLTSLALGSFVTQTPYSDAGESLKERKETELLSEQLKYLPEQMPDIKEIEERMIPVAKAIAKLIYQWES